MICQNSNMTEEGDVSIPTPVQLRETYKNSEIIKEAVTKAMTAVIAANKRGDETTSVQFSSMRILTYVMEKFKQKGYKTSVSNDHGEEARGEYYCQLELDWSK